MNARGEYHDKQVNALYARGVIVDATVAAKRTSENDVVQCGSVTRFENPVEVGRDENSLASLRR